MVRIRWGAYPLDAFKGVRQGLKLGVTETFGVERIALPQGLDFLAVHVDAEARIAFGVHGRVGVPCEENVAVERCLTAQQPAVEVGPAFPVVVGDRTRERLREVGAVAQVERTEVDVESGLLARIDDDFHRAGAHFDFDGRSDVLVEFHVDNSVLAHRVLLVPGHEAVADDVDVFHLGMVAEKMDVQTGVLSIENRLFPCGGGGDSRFPDGGGHLPERVVRRGGQLDVPEGGLRAFGGVVEHEVHAFRPLRQGREYQPGDSGGVCEIRVSCGTVRETDSLRIHEGEDALTHPQVHAVAEPGDAFPVRGDVEEYDGVFLVQFDAADFKGVDGPRRVAGTFHHLLAGTGAQARRKQQYYPNVSVFHIVCFFEFLLV